ncbi:MAG: asparagine synthase (glutamine-hydrolyzing) [bacterium]
MCGICGTLSLENGPAEKSGLLAMRSAISHRGPDDEGEHFDGPLGLGFRRLSILDLEHGHQPMSSQDGSAALVFNGEIYNHPRLKKELEGRGARYRTRSDTETILQLYSMEGENFLSRLEGMFAIALWDSGKRLLILARDPVGIKPLYYAVDRGNLFFSSELRSVAASGMSVNPDPEGVRDYLEYGYVHAPLTVLRGVRKLPPAHFLRLDLSRGGISSLPEPQRFGKIVCSEKNISEKQALDDLETLLDESVREHCQSDVPVGAFLSGGVDSSLVTALMRRHVTGKIRTFSIGFSGGRAGLDESGYARLAADYLGTEHEELILPADVLGQVEKMLPCMDEPIGDSAILPTYLLSLHARKYVKVVMTGEGGDELFAGYGRFKAAYLSRLAVKMPAWARPAAAAAARACGKGSFFRRIPFLSISDWAQAHAASPASNVEEILSPDQAARSRMRDNRAWLELIEENRGFNGLLAFDMRTVMAEALLMKVDKATMAASLEARVPFLSEKVMDYALSLPPELKIRRFKSKWILRRLASRHLPSVIAFRPKHGFWVPWEDWIRGANERLDSVLAEGAICGTGIFDMEKVRRSRAFLRNGRGYADAGLMFRIAILALWYEHLKDR